MADFKLPYSSYTDLVRNHGEPRDSRAIRWTLSRASYSKGLLQNRMQAYQLQTHLVAAQLFKECKLLECKIELIYFPDHLAIARILEAEPIYEHLPRAGSCTEGSSTGAISGPDTETDSRNKKFRASLLVDTSRH